MYVESRKVNDLIVCDRIKSTLSEGCLRHVLSVKAASKQGWLGDHELAECINLYKSNHLVNDKPYTGAIGSIPRTSIGVVGVGASNDCQTPKSSSSVKPPHVQNATRQFE